MMESFIRKIDCTGCSACFSICPQSCIEMKSDDDGFLYPNICSAKCNNCGMCVNVCPVLNKDKVSRSRTTVAYAAQNKDINILSESTSGGVFTAIATLILFKGGVVFGASYDKHFNVKHIFIDDKEGLKKFRGSKYVQSDIGDSFRIAKNHLIKGKLVCFSGTPCQIEGLLMYLGKAYTNLITIDVVCRGVPSPKVWQKYLNYHITKKGCKIENAMFRNKEKFGYAFSTMALAFKDGSKLTMGRDLEFYKKAFFKNLISRPCCHICHFKSIERVSDFTLFDCWHIGEYDRSMDNNKGATAVLIHTDKGVDYFNQIKHSLTCVAVDVSRAVKLDGVMVLHSPPVSPKRESFFRDIDKLSIPLLIEKYLPESFGKKIFEKFKPLLYRMGLLSGAMHLLMVLQKIQIKKNTATDITRDSLTR
ncbi:MAG: Coenzyme F420 hydrogenase/dehydrogenase, beta subunit C-terminal domain [Desulfobacter postgatei]|uniref:Coenzyme F420 hydrogenase/dehydrogenase, beta subunit C-terminal domain n=1 Tax=Desulfobacter postgatei TaxID=2293 RepID=UPI0023F35E99|nr:Coenzyme F420 hydrogenase/dehydrogenase, beta subunit C-terminal domain [Desulfobacter postgatei]MDD4274334.1 Coenzyme F420 hydrogenase/dehydrogenase, beta subunit C-terminal domain [Desulfobacter postgatei]